MIDIKFELFTRARKYPVRLERWQNLPLVGTFRKIQFKRLNICAWHPWKIFKTETEIETNARPI